MKYRGVFAIPPTPFYENGSLDESSLRSTIRFCIRAGAHGIVTPVNASEFIALTDDERKRVVQIAVDEVRGEIPVVAGVAGTSEEHAVYHATYAREVGADSLIAMPPYIKHANPDEIISYYQAIDVAAEGLPIWIQNNMPPVGTPMSPQLIADIMKQTDTVHYVKEECWPAGHYITQIKELAGDKLKGIHGGIAGRFLLNEYSRGVDGTMPACEICDVHVQLWNLLESGQQRAARDLFNRMLPLLNMESMYGLAVYKGVLKRRGIIASSFIRKAAHPDLDTYDEMELDHILSDLQPLFKI